jgi:hypothetical protein
MANVDFARFARANALRAQLERETADFVFTVEEEEEEIDEVETDDNNDVAIASTNVDAEPATNAPNRRQLDLLAALDNAATATADKKLPSNALVTDAPLVFDRRKSRAERAHPRRVLNYTREPIHGDSDDDDDNHSDVVVDNDSERRPKGVSLDEADADELLFDEHEDEENEKWASLQLQDADADDSNVRWDGGPLVCPACFTIVCHASRDMSTKSRIQYRARSVVNCTVSRTEVLRSLADDGIEELFAPVTCTHCSTEVGLFSAADRSLYLFHVLPSS